MKTNINSSFLQSIILSIVIALAMTACHNEQVTENTFMITPKIIRSKTASFEVAPITNEFYYIADAIPLADYNKYGEQWIADSVSRYFDNLKAYLDAAGVKYDNDYLYYRGLYDCTTSALPSETQCIFFCTRLSRKNQKPLLPFVTKVFTTTHDIRHDDFEIDIHVEGGTIYYEPNANYPYLHDFISVKELKTSYAGDFEYYVNTTITTWESFGLINQVIVNGGPSTITISDWNDKLKSGDKIIAYAVGYEENNLTTEILATTITLP